MICASICVVLVCASSALAGKNKTFYFDGDGIDQGCDGSDAVTGCLQRY